MKVLILCGGMGTRLREETEFRPKPMIEVGGRPLLWHIMKLYSHYGFREFVLLLGYKGDMIKSYFLNYHAMKSDFTVHLGSRLTIDFHDEMREDWRVTLADTGVAAMTGCRVSRGAKYVKDSEFMLTYGDGVADLDLKKALKFHRAHGKIGTVTGVRPPSRFGELHVQDGSVRRFGEKPLVSQGYINAGFFIFKRDFLKYLSDDEHLTLEREPLERLAGDGQLMMYPHDGFWQCVDTYRELQLLSDQWAKGAPWKVWKE